MPVSQDSLFNNGINPSYAITLFFAIFRTILFWYDEVVQPRFEIGPCCYTKIKGLKRDFPRLSPILNWLRYIFEEIA